MATACWIVPDAATGWPAVDEWGAGRAVVGAEVRQRRVALGVLDVHGRRLSRRPDLRERPLARRGGALRVLVANLGRADGDRDHVGVRQVGARAVARDELDAELRPGGHELLGAGQADGDVDGPVRGAAARGRGARLRRAALAVVLAEDRIRQVVADPDGRRLAVGVDDAADGERRGAGRVRPSKSTCAYGSPAKKLSPKPTPSGSTPLLATTWMQYSEPGARPLTRNVAWRFELPLPIGWLGEMFLPRRTRCRRWCRSPTRRARTRRPPTCRCRAG